MKDENVIDDEAVRKMASDIVEIVNRCSNNYDAVDEVKLYLHSILLNKTIAFSKK